MTADFGSIKTKYNLSDGDAYVVASASRTAGESPGIVVSFLNNMRPTIDNINSQERKIEVLVMALKNKRTSDVHLRHLHIQGGGDDLRTKAIKVRKEKVLLDDKGRPIEDIFRWTPLYQKGKGEIRTIERRVIEPRYYYFDVFNDRFSPIGHEKPPVDDSQFDGYTDGIPYIEVKVISRSSPKRNVPLFDPVSLESIGTGDRFGEKTLLLTVFYKGMMATEEITVPYQNNADGDTITGRNVILPQIRNKLKEIYDGKVVQDLYKYIRDKKKGVETANHPDVSKGIIDKIEESRAFNEFYGTHYTEERKRKRMQLLKRKITIKKKPVKKIKCVCPPLKKRKIATSKKKITTGGKRK